MEGFSGRAVCRTAGRGDLDVYRERTGRTSWPTEPFTEAAVIVGRRGGKSRTLALIAVYLACFGATSVSRAGRSGHDWRVGGR